ncbi:hypothetical protein SBRY_21083 [Actinacidiphila bryophytorum]|uniref:Uncharacterized protein n=1 Tax=Actinacidiphila bryophytorum TaxID=1436133 RepID=A0A9W4EDZ6_9ACTN|nr:hypothetical protein SBRY_21083 [Actinacidiphila bryophytorum]
MEPHSKGTWEAYVKRRDPTSRSSDGVSDHPGTAAGKDILKVFSRLENLRDPNYMVAASPVTAGELPPAAGRLRGSSRGSLGTGAARRGEGPFTVDRRADGARHRRRTARSGIGGGDGAARRPAHHLVTSGHTTAEDPLGRRPRPGTTRAQRTGPPRTRPVGRTARGGRRGHRHHDPRPARRRGRPAAARTGREARRVGAPRRRGRQGRRRPRRRRPRGAGRRRHPGDRGRGPGRDRRRGRLPRPGRGAVQGRRGTRRVGRGRRGRQRARRPLRRRRRRTLPAGGDPRLRPDHPSGARLRGLHARPLALRPGHAPPGRRRGGARHVRGGDVRVVGRRERPGAGPRHLARGRRRHVRGHQPQPQRRLDRGLGQRRLRLQLPHRGAAGARRRHPDRRAVLRLLFGRRHDLLDQRPVVLDRRRLGLLTRLRRTLLQELQRRRHRALQRHVLGRLQRDALARRPVQPAGARRHRPRPVAAAERRRLEGRVPLRRRQRHLHRRVRQGQHQLGQHLLLRPEPPARRRRHRPGDQLRLDRAGLLAQEHRPLLRRRQGRRVLVPDRLAAQPGLRRRLARQPDHVQLRAGDQLLPARRRPEQRHRHPDLLRPRRRAHLDRLRCAAARPGGRQGHAEDARPGGLHARTLRPLLHRRRLHLRRCHARQGQRGALARRPLRPELRQGQHHLQELRRELLVEPAAAVHHHPGALRRRVQGRRHLRPQPALPRAQRRHQAQHVAGLRHPHR